MKMMKINFCVVFFSAFFYLSLQSKAFAFNMPSFPSCVNPQGTQIASFAGGLHGIVGDQSDHIGSDSVFQVTSSQVLQCFCPSAGGSGVQTNFLKAESFSQSEINTLQAQGWILIPDGSVWGLDPVAFLAQNTNFSCSPQQGGSGSSGSSSSSSGGSSSSGSSGSSNPVQEVLGASTLAFTGNMLFIISVFFSGALLTFIGILLNKHKK